MQTLSRKNLFYVSMLLFGLFFGAGNLIFPPLLGKDAGTNSFIALAFFCITAIVIPILGVISVAKSNGLNHLAKRVDPIFAIIFTSAIYLSIGPALGIPRAGSLPFEMVVAPYLPADISLTLPRFLYTLLFFGAAYWLSQNPSKLVDRLGKLLTPLLILLLVGMFLGIVFKDTTAFPAPTLAYAANPAVKGFIEGYNTMDAVAALNFGLVISLSIRSLQIKDQKAVERYSIKAGINAGFALLVIYLMLTYIGSSTAGLFPDTENGAQVLTQAITYGFGPFGAVLLAIIFTLACLTTCVGLITSSSQYFTTLTHRVSYVTWVRVWTLSSLLLANFGLNAILSYSVPILIAIYPVSIVLILFGLIDKLKDFTLVYKITIYLTALQSILNALDLTGIQIPYLTNLFRALPFYDLGLGWVCLSALAFLGSLLLEISLRHLKH